MRKLNNLAHPEVPPKAASKGRIAPYAEFFSGLLEDVALSEVARLTQGLKILIRCFTASAPRNNVIYVKRGARQKRRTSATGAT